MKNGNSRLEKMTGQQITAFRGGPPKELRLSTHDDARESQSPLSPPPSVTHDGRTGCFVFFVVVASRLVACGVRVECVRVVSVDHHRGSR